MGIGPKHALLLALGLLGAVFVVRWIASLTAAARAGSLRPSAYEVAVGAVTDFFDTLGIGSFAPTTALFKARGTVPDRLIPGTLNVGHTVPTLVQAFIYIAIVRVDPVTLVLLIAASVAGAWVGAGVVAAWSKRSVQRGLGAGLVVAALVLGAQQLGALPAGGDSLSLEGGRLALAVGCNALLGALMTLGIGLYAPCMVLVCALGMNASAAFPIMMGSCAFLMPVAGLRFVSRQAYAPRAALGLALGGAPAVVVAAWVVRSLPLGALRWLVLAAVLLAAQSMLRASMQPGGPGARN
ncbi:MAG: permease [Polyangiaceae bacterium]